MHAFYISFCTNLFVHSLYKQLPAAQFDKSLNNFFSFDFCLECFITIGLALGEGQYILQIGLIRIDFIFGLHLLADRIIQ
jgi:hypothetical protein